MLLKPPLPPMETRSVDEIPAGDGWQYEPKWDGFRCIAFRERDNIYLQSKNGPLARYFPDVAGSLAALPEKQFVVDGELVVPVRGALSFDELQLRLHPAASRVQKLAKAHPAIYIVFDLLAEDRKSYLKLALRERRQLLEEFARSNLRSVKNVRLSPATTDYRVATKRALKRESRRSASKRALSRHAKRVARRRSARSRSSAAKKAARTRKRRR